MDHVLRGMDEIYKEDPLDVNDAAAAVANLLTLISVRDTIAHMAYQHDCRVNDMVHSYSQCHNGPLETFTPPPYSLCTPGHIRLLG